MSRALIADIFKPVVLDVELGLHREYWLSGGRGSTKSSFISILIICGMLEDADASAIIYRRVSNTLKSSVYEQMLWAINLLGANDLFKARSNPLEIVHVRTGQRILFRGADDPLKSKSIKLASGYFKYLWFEELSEFRGMEDIRSIKQSVLRGERQGITMCSFNPPKSAQSWVNEEALIPVRNRLVHKSSYLDIVEKHTDWIGAQFVEDAETLRATNERAYRNEYLGEVTGSGGAVFENAVVREITDGEILSFGYFYQGVDWGWFPDPFQWVRCAFDSKRRRLFVIDEYRANKASNGEAYAAISGRLSPDEPLTADSAENKSIADFHEYGAWWIRGAVKGAGSVAYSMKWLASLSEIVIDPVRCPFSAKEFTQYEFERNQQGQIVSGYPDKNNHAIDAVRYALSGVWRRRGE